MRALDTCQRPFGHKQKLTPPLESLADPEISQLNSQSSIEHLQVKVRSSLPTGLDRQLAPWEVHGCSICDRKFLIFCLTLVVLLLSQLYQKYNIDIVLVITTIDYRTSDYVEK